MYHSFSIQSSIMGHLRWASSTCQRQVRREGGEPAHRHLRCSSGWRKHSTHGNKYTARAPAWGEGSERGAGRPEEEETCGLRPQWHLGKEQGQWPQSRNVPVALSDMGKHRACQVRWEVQCDSWKDAPGCCVGQNWKQRLSPRMTQATEKSGWTHTRLTASCISAQLTNFGNTCQPSTFKIRAKSLPCLNSCNGCNFPNVINIDF